MYLDTNKPIASVKYNNVEMELKPPSLLPEGYTQLEYIESTGTQYIDTGFKPNGNSRVVCDFDFIGGTGSGPAVFATWSSSSGGWFCVGVTNNSTYVYYDTSAQNVASIFGRHALDFNKGVFSVDGSVLASFTNASFSSTNPLWLFNWYGFDTNAGYASIGKLYSCQIYDNGTLVRDFVPCANDVGTVGLYDIVNGVFYGSAGSGEFMSPFATDPNPVLLWTNASPTSNWSNQTITLSGEGYSAYLVETLGYKGDNPRLLLTQYLPIDGSAHVLAGIQKSASGANAIVRTFTATKTGVTTAGGSATQCIPIRIWGVKFTL